jgi:hypothetical protein
MHTIRQRLGMFHHPGSARRAPQVESTLHECKSGEAKNEPEE